MPYELLLAKTDGPLIQGCGGNIIVTSTECDFSVNEDFKSADIISAVFLSSKENSNDFYGIRYQQFNHWSKWTWLNKTENIEDIKIANEDFSIDRIINFRSQRKKDESDTRTYYVTNVFSGRGKQVTGNQVCFFLAYFTIKVDPKGDIDQNNSSSINFLPNIFNYSFSKKDGSGGDYIDYKTSLFDITNAQTPATKISLVYVYRTANSIPFGISYIIIDKTNLDNQSNGNFGGANLISNKRTLSAWSEKNIYEAINDNNKPIFYVYYDLVAETLNYVYFKVIVPPDGSSFLIDPAFGVVEKQIVFDKTSLGATPIGTIGISGNGKVVTINDHVFCLWEDTNRKLYANDILPSGLGFKSPPYPTVYQFYRDTSPIISTTGEYIIAIDYSYGGIDCGNGTYYYKEPVVNGYSYNKTTGTYSPTGQINIGNIPFDCTGGSCLVYSDGINRSNLGFRDAVFEPSKSAVDNGFSVKLWMYFFSVDFPYIGNGTRFGVLNFTKKDLNLPAGDDTSNFLDGPTIRNQATIKAILGNLN